MLLTKAGYTVWMTVRGTPLHRSMYDKNKSINQDGAEILMLGATHSERLQSQCCIPFA
jgi:hypothetical protein